MPDDGLSRLFTSLSGSLFYFLLSVIIYIPSLTLYVPAVEMMKEAGPRLYAFPNTNIEIL